MQAPTNMAQLLVFTDLDGTLLDHHDYSFDAAVPTLKTLAMMEIPCIINTSKTFAELVVLRKALNLNTPFISENGAAVWIPKGQLNCSEHLIETDTFWLKPFGPAREQLTELAQGFAKQFSFTPFSELSSADVMHLTGLTEAEAVAAMERHFTEPLVWRDSPLALERFRKELEPHGIQAQKGGRFVHLMGSQCDKAKAMAWLKEQYQQQFASPVTVIALGDGENDIGMLKAADIPVLIRSPKHLPPQIPGRHNILLTEKCGPAGWSEALNQILIREGVI